LTFIKGRAHRATDDLLWRTAPYPSGVTYRRLGISRELSGSNCGEQTHMSEPRIIKKYPNRRLYDTVESRYITLADVRRLVTEGITFVVIDKKSQEDITRSILLQVISEQEHAGEPLMSQDFLSQIIRSYGSAMQSVVGSYLEQSLRMFQQPSREASPTNASPAAAPLDPFTAMANMARQNYERWIAMQGEFLRSMTVPGMSPPSAMRPKETGTPESEDMPDDEPAVREREPERQHQRQHPR